MNLNKVILVGRLTRDPETKSLPSGQLVVSFGLATDRFFTDKTGQKQQQAEFHNIVAFGKLAETISQYLTKGSLVLIEGRLQTRSWQDSAGVKHQRTEIICQTIQLGPRNSQRERQYNNVKEEGQKIPTSTEEIPIIEEEIDIKDIPF